MVSFYGLIGVLAVSATTKGKLRAEDRLPNVVLIIADDHHWADYGFMGHPHIRTPQLDRLAAESLVYERGYVPASLCAPSLASILTGLYPHEHGIVCNDPPPGTAAADRQRQRSAAFVRGRAVLNAAIERLPTIPRLLAPLGYESLQTGKWWQGGYRVGGFTQGMTHGDEARGGRHGDAGLAIGRSTLAPIAEFLDATDATDKPFFLWYAPMLPHQPHDARAELVESYREAAPSEQVARYWANITRFDETCGELLNLVARHSEAERTLVIYLADNGWIQDPAADRYAPRSKQSPYEGGLRTPIVVRFPGRAAPRRVTQPVSSLDVLPTIAAATGVMPSAGCSGVDLLDAAAVERRDAIFGEVLLHTAQSLDDPAENLRFRWIVQGRRKLIVPDAVNEPAAKVELYDVEADPREETNLAEQLPREVAELRQRLDAWWPGRRAD
ncbi:MAG: sulfatase-like hydrolase/transferase [Pirellulales bacterium]|nr:sulfatase-like hydrolase/transferase [Pirellulales bacterium]